MAGDYGLLNVGSNTGLLNGLAEGLKGGLEAFRYERDRKDKLKANEEDKALKQAMLARQLQQEKASEQYKAAELVTKGYQPQPNGYQPKAGEQQITVGGQGLIYRPQNFVTPAEKQKQVNERESERSARADKAADRTEKSDRLKFGGQMNTEYTNLPTTKDTQHVTEAYSKIQKATEKPTPAGDMSIIYGYMRMQDPNSTVREGEFKQAGDSGSLPTKIQVYYNKLKSGERLTPEQRADFLGQARKMHAAQMEIQKKLETQYSDRATRAGLLPKDVVTDFSGGYQTGDPDAPAGLSADEAEELKKLEAKFGNKK
jgi:hypothetical protein